MTLFLVLVLTGLGAPTPSSGAQEHVSVMLELEGAPMATAYAAPGGAKRAALHRRLLEIETAQQEVLGHLTAKSAGTKVLYRVQRTYNGIAVLAPAETVSALAGIPGVRKVHRLQRVQPNNASSVPFIGAPALWDGAGRNLTGRGISIGIIDTGIDYLHPDFGGSGDAAAYAANDNTVLGDVTFPTAKVVGGYDFVGDAYNASDPENNVPAPDPDPMDANGHGTHVAGTAAGLGITADGSTFADVYGPDTPFASLLIGPGVAPEASLYALKIFGVKGDSQILIPAIEWAVDPNGDGDPSDHLDVINLSLGDVFSPSDSPESDACNNAAALGVVVVASAGNSYDACFTSGAPGSAPRVISVAASEDNDPNDSRLSADRLASFSSRGPSVNHAGRVLLKPDVSAPGRIILSAAAEATLSGSLARYASGTSMAAPHVSGTLALLRQAHADWTVEELKAVVMNTAVDVFAGADYTPPVETPQRAGAGRIRADVAAAQGVVAYDAGAEGAVGITFDTMEVLGKVSENRTVRVLNKGDSPASFTVALEALSEIPGVTLALDPASTGSIAAGAYVDITLSLSAEASLMQHTHDPAIAELFGEYTRSWISEISGRIVLTPADGGETLRVPYYGALRPASNMHSQSREVDAQNTTDPVLMLAGQALDTPGQAPLHEESLGGVYELVDISPNEASSAGLADAGDFRYIGITSDYADCIAAGKTFDDTTIYIAIASHGNWQSPHWVRFYVYFDVDNDNQSDYRLRNSFARGAGGEGDLYPDVFVSRLNDFDALDRIEGPLNGYFANEKDTAIFLNNVMVLPVRAADLGLTEDHSTFTFRLESVLINNTSSIVDEAPAELTPTVKRRIFFDARKPGVDFRDGLPGPPMFTEWLGRSVVVHFDREGYLGSGILDCDDTTGECTPLGGLGILLLHHLNLDGKRAEYLPVITSGDSDGDGIPDSVESARDTDGDGLPNLVDRDSDGDGIPDATEGAGDPDGDGVPNYLDLDSDGDGLLDRTEGVLDYDFDGIPSFLDLDSDGDGIPDEIEFRILGTNPYDTDTDDDGIPDNVEEAGDLDGDGLVNAADTDSDGDGILDAIEGTDDPDGDGIPNYLDLDSDGDGIPDVVDGLGDPDHDGIPNYLDLDSDDDGIPDTLEGTGDADNDGIPNYLDKDSDGDLLPDAMEGTADPDGDGLPNYLDMDSDGDTLPDRNELTGDPDGDGIPNYLDTDSDNDGVSDGTEANEWQTNPYRNDSDYDGIPDNVETNRDSDSDGIIDALDDDSDDDGIPDAIEGTDDPDGDGAPNYLDLDSDGDGIPDRVEGLDDADGDGLPNYLDPDSDGDGIPDLLEGVEDVDDDGAPNYLDTDSDGDGIPDVEEGIADVDGDGLPNYLDLDSDGDGLSDAEENTIYFTNPYAADSDFDGRPDGEEAAEGTDPLQANAPDAPLGVSASDGVFSDRIRVIWLALPGSVEYQVYRRESGGLEEGVAMGEWQAAVVWDDFSALPPAVIPGHGCVGAQTSLVRYEYWVVARVAPPGGPPTEAGPASASDQGYRAE